MIDFGNVFFSTKIMIAGKKSLIHFFGLGLYIRHYFFNLVADDIGIFKKPLYIQK